MHMDTFYLPVGTGETEEDRFRKSYHTVAVSRNSTIFRAEQKLRMSVTMDSIVLGRSSADRADRAGWKLSRGFKDSAISIGKS